MAAPPKGSIHKGQSTSRVTPPHPDNSGGGALRAGIERLNQNYTENKSTKPDRTGQSE